MPVAEFATPGPLRDRLVQLIQSGAKTGTSSLMSDYEAEGQPLPRLGECQALIDSTGRVVATLEITEVVTMRLAEVTWEHVLAEGEGHRSVAQWREAHEKFWTAAPPAVCAEAQGRDLHDDTLVVLDRFRLLQDPVK